jgi:GT2 family glycosyltransferase
VNPPQATVPKIAVIVTVFNRAAVTDRGLRTMLAQTGPFTLGPLVVVDDGSTDETPEILAQLQRDFPEQIVVLKGDGNLYWVRGMKMAERWVRQHVDYDYILWINDDGDFDPDAVARLVAVQTAAADRRAIVAGAVVDPDNPRRVSYGGLRRVSRLVAKMRPLGLSDVVQQADAVHGNFVLIPAATIEELDGIDGRFIHKYADWDLSLRATARGIPVLVAAGSAGSTRRNPTSKYDDPTVPRRARWEALMSPKGFPFRERYRFHTRHGPLGWLYATRLYVDIGTRILMRR